MSFSRKRGKSYDYANEAVAFSRWRRLVGKIAPGLGAVVSVGYKNLGAQGRSDFGSGEALR